LGPILPQEPVKVPGFHDQPIGEQPPGIPAEELQKKLEFENKMKEELDKVANEINNKGLEKTPDSNRTTYAQILRLCQELLPTLQYMGVVLSEQMNLPTQMQSVYTELIAKAPFYTKEQINDDTERADANTRVARYVEQLHIYRDTWGDVAKKTQSGMNITEEAINQITDMLHSQTRSLLELATLILR
jgi:hypothetical protein